MGLCTLFQNLLGGCDETRQCRAAGNRAGFVSIFVLSGEASLEDAQRAVAEGNEEQIPDLVFPSVAEIPV